MKGFIDQESVRTEGSRWLYIQSSMHVVLTLCKRSRDIFRCDSLFHTFCMIAPLCIMMLDIRTKKRMITTITKTIKNLINDRISQHTHKICDSFRSISRVTSQPFGNEVHTMNKKQQVTCTHCVRRESLVEYSKSLLFSH